MKEKKEPKAESAPVLVKKMHMHIGVDLIGSKTSLAASKTTVLTLTDVGVHAVSGSGRKILIPFSNIKGIELF
jgi:hypothetical protein